MDRSAPGFSSRQPATADVRLQSTEMVVLPRTQLQRSSGDALIQEFNKIKISSPPTRILFFRNGEWIDFPSAVFDPLRNEFVSGNTSFELRIDDCTYAFDFLAMTQVEMETSAWNSIAWIDVDGRCFFPVSAVDERRSLPRAAESASSTASFECDSAGCHRERIRGDSCEASEVASLEQPRWPGMEALRDDDRHYEIVAKVFLSGLRGFVPNAAVTAVHRCSPSGQGRVSRLKAFQLREQMTKATRGDAKIKFGWYAGSATEVAAVVAHGFGKPNSERLGTNACGIGVHLSAPRCAYRSALLAEAGAAADDERHMVLCRVIMGRPETVEAGSAQYHPSSEEFDSGVDDVTNPKWYVVWSTHMNTHILPEYILSYKCSRQPQPAPPKTANSGRAPASLNLPFPRLLAEMRGCLPSSMSRALQNIYKQYKGRKMDRDAFIRYVRSAVGDKVLISTIKKIRGY